MLSLALGCRHLHRFAGDGVLRVRKWTHSFLNVLMMSSQHCQKVNQWEILFDACGSGRSLPLPLPFPLPSPEPLSDLLSTLRKRGFMAWPVSMSWPYTSDSFLGSFAVWTKILVHFFVKTSLANSKEPVYGPIEKKTTYSAVCIMFWCLIKVFSHFSVETESWFL